MSIASEKEEYSLEKAMLKLADILKIISEDAKVYHLKNSSKVDKKILQTVGLSFSSLAILFQEFTEQWFSSISRGPDAIQPSEALNERLDIKLFETGKMDFKQMKKIMKRMHRIDDALLGLDRMLFYIKNFEDLCVKKELHKLSEIAQIFRTSAIEQANMFLSTENSRLRNQIQRCNLYYQTEINTKAVKISLISLLISSLSFSLAILAILNTFQII